MDRSTVQSAGGASTGEVIEDQLSTHANDPSVSLDLLRSLPFHDAIASLEKLLLEDALALAGENNSEAAHRLGIYRRLLY